MFARTNNEANAGFFYFPSLSLSFSFRQETEYLFNVNSIDLFCSTDNPVLCLPTSMYRMYSLAK